MTVPSYQGNLHAGLDKAVDQEVRQIGVWRGTGRNILHQRNALVGLTILVFLGLCALFADQLAQYPPDQVLIGVVDGAKKSSPPCIHVLGCPADQPQFLMGTDPNVRDVFSRVVHGARVSLFVGFVTVGFAIGIGALIGLVAGYAAGWTDNFLMRIMDILLVFCSSRSGSSPPSARAC